MSYRTFSTLSTGLTMGTRHDLHEHARDCASFSTLSTGLTMGTPLLDEVVPVRVIAFSTLSTGLTMGTLRPLREGGEP